jgi:predicted DNA-binding transcriptional regulator YafY
MAQFKSVERLSLILSYVNDHHYPSMPDILDYLTEKGLIPTERTVQRDLKTLRDLCYIEIKYNRFNNGYFIDTESASNIEYIDFDRNSLLLKNEILGKMLSAIVDRSKITFEHQNFWHNETKLIELYPHLLKQYQNRWYVFGCFPNGDFRSFGLERISNLAVLREIFKPKMKHPKDAFDEVVGLVFSQSKIEDVILSYSAEQGKYIKTQPIHSSQKTLIDDENEFRIQLRVRPNYELQEQILKQGERVKVIEPDWLKEEIKSRMINALKNY